MWTHPDLRPEVIKISRTNGVAGQLQYTARVRYPDEDVSTVAFVGSTYGGPVLMITAGFPDGTFVYDPARFGEFSPRWVRRFLGVED
jgi:hypothetical protein